MSAQWVEAIATALSTLATGVLVVVAIVQLGGLRKQLKQSADQERRRNTLDAVQRCESDPILQAAFRKVWAIASGNSDYTGTTACKFQVIAILNYYDGIAIGIAQRVYDNQMARDYLQEQLKKAVDIWLRGDTTGGRHVPAPMFGPSDFSELRGLYNQWFPEPAPAYRADQH